MRRAYTSLTRHPCSNTEYAPVVQLALLAILDEPRLILHHTIPCSGDLAQLLDAPVNARAHRCASPRPCPSAERNIPDLIALIILSSLSPIRCETSICVIRAWRSRSAASILLLTSSPLSWTVLSPRSTAGGAVQLSWPASKLTGFGSLGLPSEPVVGLISCWRMRSVAGGKMITVCFIGILNLHPNPGCLAYHTF